MKYVILMSGKMRTGKNQAADYLIEKFKEKKLTVETDLFAHDLKHNCKDDFKILARYLNEYTNGLKSIVKGFADVMTDSVIFNSLLSAIDTIKVSDENYFENKNGVTRALLQIYGTEIFRDRVDTNYWAKPVRNRAIDSKADVIVVTDARFPNEINAFGDVNGDDIKVISIRVERNTDTRDEHESETALDGYNEWNYIIDNNGSLEDLKGATGLIIEDILNHDESGDVPVEIFLNEDYKAIWDDAKAQEQKEKDASDNVNRLIKKYTPNGRPKLIK